MAIALNLMFVVFEYIFGRTYNSNVLIADSVHSILNLLGILLLWSGFSALTADKDFSFGRTRFGTILTLIASSLLLITVGFLIFGLYSTFVNPDSINGAIVMAVASVGVVINFYTAYLFNRGKNKIIRDSQRQMLGDGLVSLAAVFTGVIIYLTNAYQIDTVIAFFILIAVIYNSYAIMAKTLSTVFEATPPGISIDDIKLTIKGIIGEQSRISKLHIWSIDPEYQMLTCEIKLAKNKRKAVEFKEKIEKEIKKKYSIEEANLEIS